VYPHVLEGTCLELSNIDQCPLVHKAHQITGVRHVTSPLPPSSPLLAATVPIASFMGPGQPCSHLPMPAPDFVSVEPMTALPAECADDPSATQVDAPSLMPHIDATSTSFSAYFPSLITQDMWDGLLHSSLKGKYQDHKTSEYLVIKVVSLYYMRHPTHPCTWFVDKPGLVLPQLKLMFFNKKKWN